jgi:hypothetical protein
MVPTSSAPCTATLNQSVPHARNAVQNQFTDAGAVVLSRGPRNAVNRYHESFHLRSEQKGLPSPLALASKITIRKADQSAPAKTFN